MNDLLLDTAFGIAINSFGAAGHADAKVRLQQCFPDIDINTITEAYLLACRLHDFAYCVADKHRDGAYSQSEALVMLREQCPGFPEHTYDSAFAQGLFESR